MTADARPLAGVRVVDITHFLAGPHMTRCLAAFGAEVIKVERPPAGEEGRSHPYHRDGQSGYHLQQNMGKKGLCVDLKDPRGLEVVRRLVDVSDVLVENYRPASWTGSDSATMRWPPGTPGSSTARSRRTGGPARTRPGPATACWPKRRAG